VHFAFSSVVFCLYFDPFLFFSSLAPLLHVFYLFIFLTFSTQDFAFGLMWACLYFVYLEQKDPPISVQQHTHTHSLYI
jgi:hypothetical protein